MNTENKGEIKIYQNDIGNIEVQVNFEEETVWLDSYQIAAIFGKDRTTIQRHIKNIYSRGELDENSTCAKNAQVQIEGGREITRNKSLYNLDLILAVGYITNSTQAIEFRKWVSNILKNYLINGYSINEKRLSETGINEFEKAISLIKRNISNNQLRNKEIQGMLSLVTNYAHSRIILQKYDEGSLALENFNIIDTEKLSYKEALEAIGNMREELLPRGEVSEMFGIEKDDGLKGVLNQVYQTFDNEELYPSIQEKAAAIIYFTIKNHPFIDGNKKIGAFLLLVFLAKNNFLYKNDGEKIIDDDTLIALTLLIATSESGEKNMILKLVAGFLDNK